MLEIFDSLQGEGYWTGIPMTFVRLAGCNAPELGLDCARWCDTRGSWDRTTGDEMDVLEILRRVRLPRLCLTGGEPLLQVDGVAELVAEAHRRDIRVHLETNGTLDPRAGPAAACPGFDWATVSPKPPDYAIAPGWEGLVDELKLVVDDTSTRPPRSGWPRRIPRRSSPSSRKRERDAIPSSGPSVWS